MATTTWTGGSSITTADWDDSTHWSAGLPGGGDGAVIDTTLTAKGPDTVDVSAAESVSAGSVTLDPAGHAWTMSLNIDGSLKTYGNLVVGGPNFNGSSNRVYVSVSQGGTLTVLGAGQMQKGSSFQVVQGGIASFGVGFAGDTDGGEILNINGSMDVSGNPFQFGGGISDQLNVGGTLVAHNAFILNGGTGTHALPFNMSGGTVQVGGSSQWTGINVTFGDKSNLVLNGSVNLDAQSSLKLLDGTATISGISSFTDQAPTLIGGTLDVTGDMAVLGTATVYGSLVLSPDAGKGFDASSGLVIGSGVGASIVFASAAGTVAGNFTLQSGALFDMTQDAGTGGVDPLSGVVLSVDASSSINAGFAAGGNLRASISASGGTLVVTGVGGAPATASYAPFFHAITISTPGGTEVLSQVSLANFGPAAALAGTFSGANNGTETFALACFVRGTHILTERGEVAVEALAPDDWAITASGHAMRIQWVGRRRIDLRKHPRPDSARPIRICQDALGPGVPKRDLLVSADHALFFEDVLVPAQYLVNGATVLRDQHVETVEYFHVELEVHDVILAEGLAAESYLDTGNRNCFEAGETLLLHPDFSPETAIAKRWECDSYAPLRGDGVEVREMRRRLHKRAYALGYVTTVTDIHLHLGDRRLAPARVDGTRLSFDLPALGDVHIVSSVGAPAWFDVGCDDRRQLGIMVTRIVLGRPEGDVDIALEDPRLSIGFHACEHDGSVAWRWTDGDAVLPAALLGGARCLHLDVPVRIPVWRHRDMRAGVGVEPAMTCVSGHAAA